MSSATFRLSCFLVLAATTNCTGTEGPTLPSKVPGPLASLVIEDASVLVRPSRYRALRFEYEPLFRLHETSGLSGATIRDVFVGDARGGGDHWGPDYCWGQVLRIPPGETLDIFNQLDWTDDCYMTSGGDSDEPEVHLTVTYVDDAGRQAVVRAVAKRK